MPMPNSAEGFFKRAHERGAENETDIINDEEVEKDLQPGTKNNYRRALALWHQWVLRWHLGMNHFSDSFVDTRLNIQALHQSC
jgi:hypothetical protein